MRHFKLLMVAVGLLATTVSCTPPLSTESYADLTREFANPSKEYRSAPLWVWNSTMTKSDIDRMLTEFKEQGFGGAFVHPRYGLTTEYLSQEWLDLFDYSVQKGKELDLNIWIYDENSYPSGFGGGHVTYNMPESYNQGQGLKPHDFETLPTNVDSMMYVFVDNGGTIENITGKTKAYMGKTGKYICFEKTYYGASPWTAGKPYVDVMVKGVTEKFLDVTIEQAYKKKNGKEFGSYVPGSFTDEPEIAAPGGSFRWTPDLFAVFQEKFGYSLEENLPLLSWNSGDYRKVRHDYYATLLSMFIDRFAKIYHDYCEANHLVFTGHVWEHGWPGIGLGPDNMAFSAWQQMPGIDMLFNQFDEKSPRAQFGNIRAVKEVRSVANQMGRKRVLSETYGGAGWDVSFKDLKRLGDWEYVFGVNFMNQHLSHTSFIGCRKYDYPPMFTEAATWWENYEQMNTYYGRLSAALSMGEQMNDVLLLEPTTTLWLHSIYMRGVPVVEEIGNLFQKLVADMAKAQINCDLGSEDVIKNHGRSSSGLFTVGQRSYKAVIIPPMMENIEKETFDLLKQFIADGGKVIAYATPSRISGRESDEAKTLFSHSNVIHLTDATMPALASTLPDTGVKMVKSGGGNPYHQLRQYRDGQLFFFVNSDMEQASKLTVTVEESTVVELDAMDGNVYTYPHDKSAKSFDVSLEPAESKLIFVSNASIKAQDRPMAETTTPLSASSAMTISRVQDNVLTLDRVDLKMGSLSMKNAYILDASKEAFKKAGFENGNPWFSAMQYKTMILDRDTIKGNGFTATYRFMVDPKFTALADLKIAVERPSLYTIKVNGKEVKPSNKHLFDKELLIIPIGEAAKAGENTIELILENFSVFAEIDHVYVLGNFSVLSNERNFFLSDVQPITELGLWRDQGCPFYPYGMSYTKQYTVSKAENKQFVLKADSWKGILAEVYVNGAKAGILFSNPYTLNITNALTDGENTVEVRVIGSLDNMIGPFNSDPRGLTGPGSWRGVDKPSDFKFTPYGLTGDFTLFSN